MSLLGKSAQELNPLIKQGTSALREYMAAADENYVLTEDQIEALAELDDQVQRNRLQWESLKMQISAQFAPAAKEALEKFGELVMKAGKALIDSGIIDAVGNLLVFLADMLTPITKLLTVADEAPGRLSPVATVLKAISYALAQVQDTVQLLLGIMPWNWFSGMASTALGLNASKGELSATQKVYYGDYQSYGWTYDASKGGWVGNYPGQNASGNDNWRGGLTWVGESGPELVSLPSGSQIYSNQDSRLGGDTFYITIDAASVREFNDIVEMAQSARVRSRMR